MRMRAVRGATTVERDENEILIKATAELIQEMMKRNDLTKDDLVSLIFTATPDLTSEFPAAAARSLGISDVPLLCATEIAVRGAIPRCVRVMMHVYTDRDYSTLRHVYLGDARQLRTDLPE
jgi:chorismate mutase